MSDDPVKYRLVWEARIEVANYKRGYFAGHTPAVYGTGRSSSEAYKNLLQGCRAETERLSDLYRALSDTEERTA